MAQPRQSLAQHVDRVPGALLVALCVEKLHLHVVREVVLNGFDCLSFRSPRSQAVCDATKD